MAKAAKCDNCLRKAAISVTGVNPSNTLKIDIGGAILFVIPMPDGGIDIRMDSHNLIDGDYAVCEWDGEKWIITR